MPVTHVWRNMLLLAKIQAVIGTAETPTPGSNAVRARRNLRWAANLETIDTDEVTGSISDSEPLVGGGGVEFSMPTYLQGSGTGGTAPDIGPMLRACGLQESTLAVAVTGTAAAGAAGSITLEVGDSQADDFYNYMIITLTGGTGSGQTRIITDYTTSNEICTVYPNWTITPDATSAYSIAACNIYKPRSSGLEALTSWMYQHNVNAAADSRLRKIFDAMGRASVGLTPGGIPTIDFTFMGRLVENPTDVTKPANPTYQARSEQPFLSADAYLGGSAIQFIDFSLEIANDVQMFGNPADTLGRDSATVVSRRVNGSISPSLSLISTRNAFADWRNSTERALWFRWGSVAGKRVSLFCPRLRYVGNEMAESQGFAIERIPFRAVGEDAEAIWTFH